MNDLNIAYDQYFVNDVLFCSLIVSFLYNSYMLK